MYMYSEVIYEQCNECSVALTEESEPRAPAALQLARTELDHLREQLPLVLLRHVSR